MLLLNSYPDPPFLNPVSSPGVQKCIPPVITIVSAFFLIHHQITDCLKLAIYI